MTVAPLIAMKSTKCESLEAVGKELDRRAHTYANDVDQSGRHVGYLCRAGDESPVPLEQAIERRMGELNTKRKIRDNQVRAMGFIVSSNDALDEKGAMKSFGLLRAKRIASEERLDGLRWQLRASPEGSRPGERG